MNGVHAQLKRKIIINDNNSKMLNVKRNWVINYVLCTLDGVHMNFLVPCIQLARVKLNNIVSYGMKMNDC